MNQSTRFSEDRIYRYTLWRDWSGDYGFFNQPKHPGSYVNFIGLNPSTADENQDDPTIRRCIGFAKDWGYPAFCMTNLFAFRETKPAEMRKQADPVGPDNDQNLVRMAKDAGIVIAAWGHHGNFQRRNEKVLALLKEAGVQLYALALTADEGPRHPLYLPRSSQPMPWPPGTGVVPVRKLRLEQ